MGYKVKITRGYMDDRVTLGMLQIEGVKHEPIWTLELPWKNNARNESCIPSGKYKASRHNGAKFKQVYALADVPGRSGILIHQGNTVRDIEGCILIGLGTGMSNGTPSVFASKLAMEYLNKLLGNQPFEVEIKE